MTKGLDRPVLESEKKETIDIETPHASYKVIYHEHTPQSRLNSPQGVRRIVGRVDAVALENFSALQSVEEIEAFAPGYGLAEVINFVKSGDGTDTILAADVGMEVEEDIRQLLEGYSALPEAAVAG